MFTGLSYSNVAHYCPNSDETILGHLAQMRQNVQSIKLQSKSCPNPPPIIKTTHTTAYSIAVSTQSVNYILMTQDASSYGHAWATNMS